MPRFNSKLVFIAACFGMLIFGIVMAVLGSVLPSVILKFEIDKVDAGSLFVLLSLGTLFGSIVFGPLVDRFGYKPLLIICAAIIVVGFQGIAYAPSMAFLRFSLFLSGLAGGAINGGTNALVSDISEGKRGSRLTYLGVFFGVGAFGVPLLLGTLLDRFTYETLISGVGAMIIFPLLLFIVLRFPLPKHEQGFPVAEGIGLLKEPILLLLGVILLIQSGMEMAVGGWTSTYFNEVLEVDSQRAVLFLSFFWLGLMVTRAILGYLLLYFSASLILQISLVSAIAGSLIMIMTESAAAGLFGLILTGIGFAAVFPVILAYTGDLYAKLSGTAIGITLAMSLLGGMILPYVIGLLADAHDLRIGLMIIPASLLVSLLVFRLVYRQIKAARNHDEPVTDFEKLPDTT